MKTFLSQALLALFLISSTQVFAQNKIECRLLTFDKHTADEQLFYSTNDQDPSDAQPVALEKNNFSNPFEVERKTLRFYHKDLITLGNEAASIDLSQWNTQKLVLICLPIFDKEAKNGRYAITAVADDANFKQGQRLILNLTSYEIGCRLEDTKVKVSPMKMKLLPAIKAANGKGAIESEILMRKKGMDEWMPLSSSIWKHDAKARSYVFFFWDPAKKRVRIRSVREVVQ